MIIIAGIPRRLSSSSSRIIIGHHHECPRYQPPSRILIPSSSLTFTNIVANIGLTNHLREHRIHHPSSNSSTHLPSSSQTSGSPTLAYHHCRFQPLRTTKPPLQQHEVDRSICTTSFIMFSVYACCCGRLAKRCYTLRDRRWSSIIDSRMWVFLRVYDCVSFCLLSLILYLLSPSIYKDNEQRLTARPGIVAADFSFARTIFDMGQQYMVSGSANTISGHPGHSFCYETSESTWVGSWICRS